MKKFDSTLLKIFLYGLPLFVVLAVFAYCYSEGIVDRDADYARLLNNFAGLIITVWMTLALYLSVRLMVSGQLRDQVIAKITFMRERDEREALLTGKATKATFLTSLAILIFLFSLSCFQVSVYRVPPDKAVDGKTGMVSLGMGFSLLESDKQKQRTENIQKEYIFDYRGLPISSETIILLLIIWHIGFYNYSMRKLLK
ncbi:MAG TPA: hypothetical protein PKZ42_11890 [Syntrophales bacterium]|nr:hypothetical protein [Syntrophales bacterium]